MHHAIEKLCLFYLLDQRDMAFDWSVALHPSISDSLYAAGECFVEQLQEDVSLVDTILHQSGSYLLRCHPPQSPNAREGCGIRR